MLRSVNPKSGYDSNAETSPESDQLKSLMQDRIAIGQASFPAPFPHSLEFNPPVHGTMNIVHIGMGMPESHQIYVCAINCMRGVVLTAAEMNAADRFSCVVFHEDDLVLGRVEDITIKGTIDVIRKLPKHPKAVMLFTVCTHHFLGCNLDYIYQKLEEAYPDIHFIRCFMDPIKQKEGLTPDQKLRIAMYSVLPEQPVKRKVSVLGSNYPLIGENELAQIATMFHADFAENRTCRDYAEFERLGEAGVFVSIVPNGKLAADAQAERFNRENLYLPGVFDFDEIRDEIWNYADSLASHFGGKTKSEESLVSQMYHNPVCSGKVSADGENSCRSDCSDNCNDDEAEIWNRIDAMLEKEEQDAIQILKETKNLLGDSPVYIDYTVHPRPLGMAKLLLSYGFNVQGIFANALSAEEEKEFKWLKENAPELPVIMTIHPRARIRDRRFEKEDGKKVLAIGQQAAWFTGTAHFVNIVEGGGLWGFSGIIRLCELMQDAFLHEKDTRQIVPRKGLGCESCV